MPSPANFVERRRQPPALVVAFSLQQIVILAVLAVLIAGGIMLWMTTTARYQVLAADRLEALSNQAAIMQETIDAHVRRVEADNAAFLFYARAVCEQVAMMGKQSAALCRFEELKPPR